MKRVPATRSGAGEMNGGHMVEQRANKWEFETLKLLAHLVAELVEDGAHLERLETACEKQGCVAALTESAKGALACLTSTLPLNQRKQLMRHVSDMKVTFSSPVAVSRDEAYSYVPRETILRLIQSAAADKCALCLSGAEEVASCEFRKAVNELRMDNLPDDIRGCTARLLIK
ncbi:MAG: hypothetical protein PHI98_01260 [Eubacteriales bacterium]|nr:hypothetical protein [Eubacteriales bacterium]